MFGSKHNLFQQRVENFSIPLSETKGARVREAMKAIDWPKFKEALAKEFYDIHVEAVNSIAKRFEKEGHPEMASRIRQHIQHVK